MIKYLLPLLFFIPQLGWASDHVSSLKYLPVQNAGRIKPFDSFSREALQMLYGKQKYHKKNAHEVVFTWMLVPMEWDKTPLIELSNSALKKALKVKDVEKKHYTPLELFNNDRVGLLFTELRLKLERKEKLNDYYQAVQRLNNQLNMYHSIKKGIAIRVMPSLDKNNTAWVSVADLQGDYREKFKDIVQSFTHQISGSQLDENKPLLSDSIDLFTQAVQKSVGTKPYYDKIRIKTEVWLHDTQPFLIACLLYLLAAILLTVAWLSSKPKIYKAGWGLVILAFIVHTVGFIVRVYIIKRPPVSNMYETVVWAPWGTVLFACILEYIYKKRIILLAACIVSALCLFLASIAPTILDPSLHPLEAVLRSTFWLATHVVLIVLSYGAFFLSWAIGNFVIFASLINESKYKTQIKEGAIAIYRANQIGVVLLAFGIILGGIWADYSWGRFWGWDPKETWALIAFLGYLAVLHAKIVGLIKDFGMAASSVAAFSLVVMAWYGVNYWLGAGLHSYGFGAGGIGYVAIAVCIQILFVLAAVSLRHTQQSKK